MDNIHTSGLCIKCYVKVRTLFGSLPGLNALKRILSSIYYSNHNTVSKIRFGKLIFNNIISNTKNSHYVLKFGVYFN
jgi:hypothetical protein